MTKGDHVIAYIGLGSNLGDRESHLSSAIDLLHSDPEVEVANCSHIYETAPVGYLEQPAFLNMVVAVNTKRSAERLFALMTAIERQLGRIRDIRWGPRTIDLDLLLYNNSVLNTMDLTIPHPRMHERAFVMIPLADVCLEEPVPGMGSISDRLLGLDDKGEVKLWKSINWRKE